MLKILEEKLSKENSEDDVNSTVSGGLHVERAIPVCGWKDYIILGGFRRQNMNKYGSIKD